MKFSQLLEDATGYTGTSSIAANPSTDGGMRRRPGARSGDLDWHNSIRAEKEGRGTSAMTPEMQARARQNHGSAKAKLAKQKSFMGRLKSYLEQKSSKRTFRISESFDVNDVVSRLSGLEKGNTDNTVTYGVEDDEGNLMKVTVRSDQAEEFETRLANELADAAQRKEVTAGNTGVSMAELLYNLNSEFDIVDVQFPTIPTDAVYNADKVQYGIADTAQENIGMEDDLSAFPDGNPNDPNAGDPAAMGGEMGGEMDPTAGGGLPPVGGEGELDTLGGQDAGMGGEGDEFFDDESVEEMPPEAPAADSSPESLLSSILSMLKSDAEARKAEADARAEEARAQQAEHTARATERAVQEQEEMARMEADADRQKQREKEARRIADLAKYRVQAASAATRTFGESAKPTFGQYLDTLVLEADQFDTVQSLNREKTNIRTKYAPAQGDTPEMIRFKREALQAGYKEIEAKLRRVQAAARYEADTARKNKTTQQPQQAQRPGQQQQQQQQQPGQAPNATNQPPVM